VISCENPTRSPATAVPAPPATHMRPSVIKEPRPKVPKRRSPHPASGAQVGRSRYPLGRWTWTVSYGPGSIPPRCAFLTCPYRDANRPPSRSNRMNRPVPRGLAPTSSGFR